MHLPFLANQKFWHFVAIAAAVAKVIFTIISLRWSGGAKDMLASRKGRLVYFLGKVTPVIAVGAVLMRVNVMEPTINPAWSALAFVALIVYVVFIVWLRLTNRWYGFAHMIKSRRPSGSA